MTTTIPVPDSWEVVFNGNLFTRGTITLGEVPFKLRDNNIEYPWFSWNNRIYWINENTEPVDTNLTIYDLRFKRR